MRWIACWSLLALRFPVLLPLLLLLGSFFIKLRRLIGELVELKELSNAQVILMFIFPFSLDLSSLEEEIYHLIEGLVRDWSLEVMIDQIVQSRTELLQLEEQQLILIMFQDLLSIHILSREYEVEELKINLDRGPVVQHRLLSRLQAPSVNEETILPKILDLEVIELWIEGDNCCYL